MKWLGCALAALAAAIAVAQNPGLCGDTPGCVVDSDKGWRKGAGAELKRGDSLAATDVITGTQNRSLVVACGARSWLLYTCTGANCRANVCGAIESGTRREVHPYASAPEPASVVGILTALFRREPASPQTLSARSGGNPSDAVVRQSAKGVHWGPALARVLEGRYCFLVSRLPGGAAAASFVLMWDRAVDAEGIAAVPGLAPGLYSIEKGAPQAGGRCEADADGGTAWTLVTPEARFGPINEGWSDGLARIEKLERSGTPRLALEAARHGVLAALAESMERR
jgi:hypothetical protein